MMWTGRFNERPVLIEEIYYCLEAIVMSGLRGL